MLRSTLLVMLFAFSSAAFAEDFSYNNVNLTFGQLTIDDPAGDADADMIGFNGSYEINESFFGFAGYSTGDLEDGGPISADVELWRIGVGYHMPLTENVDLVTSLSYEFVDISISGFPGADDSGLGAALGLRYAMSESIEVNAGVSYADRGDLEPVIDETLLNLGVLYNFNDTFSAGVSGEWGDDMSTYTLGGRFYFGD